MSPSSSSSSIHRYPLTRPSTWVAAALVVGAASAQSLRGSHFPKQPPLLENQNGRQLTATSVSDVMLQVNQDATTAYAAVGDALAFASGSATDTFSSVSTLHEVVKHRKQDEVTNTSGVLGNMSRVFLQTETHLGHNSSQVLTQSKASSLSTFPPIQTKIQDAYEITVRHYDGMYLASLKACNASGDTCGADLLTAISSSKSRRDAANSTLTNLLNSYNIDGNAGIMVGSITQNASAAVNTATSQQLNGLFTQTSISFLTAQKDLAATLAALSPDFLDPGLTLLNTSLHSNSGDNIFTVANVANASIEAEVLQSKELLQAASTKASEEITLAGDLTKDKKDERALRLKELNSLRHLALDSKVQIVMNSIEYVAAAFTILEFGHMAMPHLQNWASKKLPSHFSGYAQSSQGRLADIPSNRNAIDLASVKDGWRLIPGGGSRELLKGDRVIGAVDNLIDSFGAVDIWKMFSNTPGRE
jgi:hypothetical protein